MKGQLEVFNEIRNDLVLKKNLEDFQHQRFLDKKKQEKIEKEILDRNDSQT